MKRIFRKEIIFILILKIIFLTTIWYVCFRNPLGDRLNDQLVGAHWVDSGAEGHVLIQKNSL